MRSVRSPPLSASDRNTAVEEPLGARAAQWNSAEARSPPRSGWPGGDARRDLGVRSRCDLRSCAAAGSGPPGGSPVPAGDAAAGGRLDCRRVTAQEWQ
ncbi:hypothetical protein VNO78_03201 [Psophocarpus tetragonolobus]|uniref:Uncharacterized protein n=1 Tax=Psophocarpus tetragonolobus TaxID=3891 RepID=A0AAN9T3W5_PSOTE